MKQEMDMTPNEMPILYVLFTLGVLSFLATITVVALHDSSSNTVMLAGIISGICAIPLGSMIYEMMSGVPRIASKCSA